MSAEGYFIIAHAVNATDIQRATVELEVASETTDGRWITNNGDEVWPFWKQPIEFETPNMPDNWIDHLHNIANRQFKSAPTLSLAEALGFTSKPKPKDTSSPFPRRV